MNQPNQFDTLFLSFQAALAGRYSIERELGRGGMGIVYLAREVQLDRFVAIKLLPPELAARSDLRERFLREAQLAAKLSHPNIIPIHAVEQVDTFVYFAMAFVDGETLTQRVQSRGPLAVSEGIRVLREVAWALGYAHGQGLVHRDIKPDNILIESCTGRALVADFGIRTVTGDASNDGVNGTPEFMSPEQAMNADLSGSSDIYSLGVTAFYALTGRLPFTGKTPAELLGKHVSLRAPSVTKTGVALPKSLAQIVDQCLLKEPSARPASALALADSLGLTIEKRRELPAALRAFVKRNGRMDGGGTILSLLGTLVVSVATSALAGPASGIAVLAAGVMVLPGVFGVLAARNLLRQGFTQDDSRPAFSAEKESSREERVVQVTSGFSWRRMAERAFSRIARVFGSTALVLVPLALLSAGSPRFALFTAIIALVLGVAAFSTFVYLLLLQLRRDVDIEFWSRVWTGRFGDLAFSIAKKLRGAVPIAPAMTHRATELSLGIASEQLFESLPKATREALGDVPALLHQLQKDTNTLRARGNSLQDVLAQAGSAASSAEFASVREELDEVQQKLRQVVGAMEAMRLGLLRLHAGSVTLQTFTTHVNLAAETSTHIGRMFEAQNEVHNLLGESPRVSPVAQLTPA